MRTIKIEQPVITIPVEVAVMEVDPSLPEYTDIFPGMPEPFKDVVINDGVSIKNFNLIAM